MLSPYFPLPPHQVYADRPSTDAQVRWVREWGGARFASIISPKTAEKAVVGRMTLPRSKAVEEFEAPTLDEVASAMADRVREDLGLPPFGMVARNRERELERALFAAELGGRAAEAEALRREIVASSVLGGPRGVRARWQR